ncbi:MAG: heavy metal translocating P-type ATPase metal-binding domain-containing protein [Ignavibacteria bacterium]|nr:heavy metal translocating P-type ATPase metal-binding domain-containing protein [Ignavibacteria bacterium]
MFKVKEISDTKCYHCGDLCRSDRISSGEKNFCCAGCKAVYEILNGNDLCNYYNLDEKPGFKTGSDISMHRFDFLDDIEIQNRIIEFRDKNISKVTFVIPVIHCTSCIWLLEKLYKINDAVLSSKVDFLRKTVSIIFDNSKSSLKEVVILLTSVGYEPQLNLENNDPVKKSLFRSNSKLLLKIGTAGFCLGNIMLLSFPEYLGLDSVTDGNLKLLFNYLNILFSLPVFFYSASDYFSSAWNGIKNKMINIDFPISLGLLSLFVRSLYEIIFFGNAGFVDSLAGLVFLLLLGKLFQSKTYETLNFERDYKSYFPLSVTVKKDCILKSIPVSKINIGDRLIIRNNEIVPVDSILFNGNGNIDYSFVTGESIPEQKVLGEIIYAGGKHMGSAIELEAVRKVSQSYLTQLWNDKAFGKSHSEVQNLTNKVSRYFTVIILVIAFASALYWLRTDINLALNAFTTVLIIACPCALALTAPFALGNAMRILGKNKFYLKNSYVIESLSKINTIVFDKTGTITNTKDINVKFTGSDLNICEQAMVKSLVRNSSHPLSRLIYDSLRINEIYEVNDFSESLSEGISCKINGKRIKLGTIRFVLEGLKSNFCETRNEINAPAFSTNVFLAINDSVKGFFTFNNNYREGLEKLIGSLSEKYDLSLISGDNDSEKHNLLRYFRSENLNFAQTPSDKLYFIKNLQSKGKNVLMIGDGLNDAGALKQSDTGISVSEDVMNFSPACDAIADAASFQRISEFIGFSLTTMKIIKVSFLISFIYNIIGLYLAAQGTFSPLIAAILMPFNSISIILFVTGMTNFFAKRRNLI